MSGIRKIYTSFIPFVVIFLGMLITIGVMDQYAERLAKKPEIIVVSGEKDVSESDQILWHTNDEVSDTDKLGLRSDSVFLQAEEAFQNKNYNQARMLFSLLSKTYSGSAIPHNYLGVIAIRNNNIPQAIESFRRAMEADSTWYKAKVNLASALKKANRTREAKRFYLEAAQLNPNDPDIYYNLGILMLDESNPGDARGAFNRSIELSSGKKKAQSYCMLGIAKLQQLDTLGAKADFNEAILLWPNYELARLNYAKTLGDEAKQLEEFQKIYRLNNRSFHANLYLANHYIEQDDLSRAEYHYRKALDRDPSNIKVIEALANILIDQQRMTEAALVIDGFVAGDTLPQAYFMRAKIAAREDKLDEATKLYEIAIEKSNGAYPEAHVNLAIIQKAQGNFKEAIQSYREAIRIRPNYSLAYYNMALIYTETDSIDRAIESYRQSALLDSASYKSWYNLGRLYDKIRENELEIDAYQNALKVKPDYTRALLELGNAYMDVNDYKQSIDAYNKLLAIYPKYSKAWYNLGLSYTRQNQPDEAIDAFEKLLQLEPEHIQGSINLASLYTKRGQTELATLTMEAVLSVDIDNPEIRQILGEYYHEAGSPDKAAYQYQRLIDLQPKNKNYYEKLIDIYKEQNDTLNIELINFFMHLNLNLKYDFYKAAKNLHELGLYKEALKAYIFAQKNGNNNIWVDYWIGKTYMDMEAFDRAIPKFEKVLQEDPKHKFAWYRLGQTFDMLGESEKAETYYGKLRLLDEEFKIVRKKAVN